MNPISFNHLQSRLIADEKLTLPYAAIMAENAIFRFEPEVRGGVQQWLDGTLTKDFSVGDTSLGEIQDEVGGSLFQALCILDILTKDPARVEDAVWLVREDRIYEQ